MDKDEAIDKLLEEASDPRVTQARFEMLMDRIRSIRKGS